MDFRQFDKKNWLGLIVACFFGLILLVHGIVVVWSLYSQNILFAWNTAFDLLAGISEFLIGLFLILLGIYQEDAITSLSSVGDWIVKYLLPRKAIQL
jgi:hypothetical protein